MAGKQHQASATCSVEVCRWVFGYGSLVNLQSLRKTLGRDRLSPGDYIYCSLKGYVRTWNVAMDNRLQLPGYKHYQTVEGKTPEVGVTFLNLTRTDGESAVNGILFRVNGSEFHRLTKREKNYVAAEIEPVLNIESPADRISVFLATVGGYERYQRFRSSGNAVISKEYLELVERAFKTSEPGEGYYQEYLKSTEMPKIPVRPLKKVEL